jgi:hypothetical protein
MTEWRPIKTFPKEDEDTVLVSVTLGGDDNYVDMLTWRGGYWMRRDDEILPSDHTVTHWMPLPPPPLSK